MLYNKNNWLEKGCQHTGGAQHSDMEKFTVVTTTATETVHADTFDYPTSGDGWVRFVDKDNNQVLHAFNAQHVISITQTDKVLALFTAGKIKM